MYPHAYQNQQEEAVVNSSSLILWKRLQFEPEETVRLIPKDYDQLPHANYQTKYANRFAPAWGWNHIAFYLEGRIVIGAWETVAQEGDSTFPFVIHLIVVTRNVVLSWR